MLQYQPTALVLSFKCSMPIKSVILTFSDLAFYNIPSPILFKLIILIKKMSFICVCSMCTGFKVNGTFWHISRMHTKDHRQKISGMASDELLLSEGSVQGLWIYMPFQGWGSKTLIRFSKLGEESLWPEKDWKPLF